MIEMLLDYLHSKIIENMKTDLTARTVNGMLVGWSDIHNTQVIKTDNEWKSKTENILH